MRVTHLVQIFGNADFHVVGYVLVLLDSAQELAELVVVLFYEQFLNHAEHALDAFAERDNLLLCFEDRQFGGLHDASRNEMQTEVFLFLRTLWLDNHADEFLNLWHEPDEQSRIGDVESGVECSEGNTCFDGKIWCIWGHRGVEAGDVTYHLEERVKQEQHPKDTYGIEAEVGEGSSSGLCVSAESYDVRGYGGAHVLTQHEHYALFNLQNTSRAEHHRDSHNGGRGLHAKCQNRTYDEEEQIHHEASIAVFFEEGSNGFLRFG